MSNSQSPLDALMVRQIAWEIFVQDNKSIHGNPNLKGIVQELIPGIRKELGLDPNQGNQSAVADTFINNHFKKGILKGWDAEMWWALHAPFHGQVRKMSDKPQVSEIEIHSGNLYGFQIQYDLQSPRLNVLVGVNYPEIYFGDHDHRALYILNVIEGSQKEPALYIGQATSMRDRLKEHLRDEKKKVVWWFLAYPDEDGVDFNTEILDVGELMLIHYWGEVVELANTKRTSNDLHPSEKAINMGAQISQLISATYIWILRKQQKQIAKKLNLDIQKEWLPPFYKWQGTPGWSECYWK